MSHSLLVIVLAAGKGTRMKSDVPKVLHKIAGRSMLGHVLGLAQACGAEQLAAVVGPEMEAVALEARRQSKDVLVFVQRAQLGTADAVRAADPAIGRHAGDVIVMFGDTPLFTRETVAALREKLAAGCDLVVAGFEAADPTGYGRLVVDEKGALAAIREEKDATPEQRAIRLCNAGLMGFRADALRTILPLIGNANASGEFYLTDAVEIAVARSLRTGHVVCPEDEVLGINARDQLAAAEAIWQRRRRVEAMRAGATLIAPDTVWLSHDTMIGRDVVIEPNVFVGPGVVIEDGAIIKANCHIEGHDAKSKAGIRIRARAEIGPFARLRPGADIGPAAHIGNFVEVKNAVLEAGAKANHLAYIGDGRVGEDANIGAGTIFCNYDGFAKHHTEVGRGAFVGSNSSLVAPVTIGEGAYVGSGSVVTKAVPADALAVSRAPQETHAGWAARYRARRQRRSPPKATGSET